MGWQEAGRLLWAWLLLSSWGSCKDGLREPAMLTDYREAWLYGRMQPALPQLYLAQLEL